LTTNESSERPKEIRDLKKTICEIIDLAEELDERYREKCFEILLNFYLHGTKLSTEASSEETQTDGERNDDREEFLLPIDVRAFLQQNRISEEIIDKLFLIQKDAIRPIYKITTTKKAKAQIQIALLTALENIIRKQGNKLEFSVEDVRKRCQNLNVYDGANFRRHFSNNLRLFKSLDKDIVELSPEGQTELADVITTVAK
jgi:hypothetical protein